MDVLMNYIEPQSRDIKQVSIKIVNKLR
jgi:hypothetical protein